MPEGMDILPGRGRFPRAVRLGGNREYRIVYKRGASHPARSMALIYLKGKGVKIGFSASKKVGGAVTRNRVRRYMREDARKLLPRLMPGRYVFVARATAAELAHSALTRDMIYLLSRAKLIKAAEE